MIGKPLRVICVGKIKTAYWKAACDTYKERISRFRRLEICEVKDAEGCADSQTRNSREGKALLDALGSQDKVIVLDERGKDMTSEQLARYLNELDALGQGRTSFVIGGPFGLSQEVKARANLLLRVSAMTFPHELARVVLLEQLYRALCILQHVPYHH